MARLLTYTSPARGHLYPIVATLLELRDRGHDVHVRTLASEVAAVQDAGLAAAPIDPAIEALPLDDWRWPTPEECLAGGLRTFAARVEHEVPDLQRAIAEVEPDLLLVDVTTAGAAAVAEASGLPWAQWCPFFQHYGPAPEEGPPPTLIPFTLMPAGMEVLDAPRRRVGLPALEGPADAWRAPLMLYLTAEPLEPAGMRYPPSVRTVGPGLWEPARSAPAWLDEPADPLVLVTASSELQGDDALLAVALEALRDESVRVVATSAAHDAHRFGGAPGARVERWLPHGPLVARAACVVCHGGMGITQRALAAGVPVCVVPFGRDQSQVARRVAAVEAGTQLAPAELGPEALRRAVREAMGMRAGAREVAAGFARAGGPSRAATEVESLLTPRARPLAAAHSGTG